jgi:hypothetical protein
MRLGRFAGGISLLPQESCFWQKARSFNNVTFNGAKVLIFAPRRM